MLRVNGRSSEQLKETLTQFYRTDHVSLLGIAYILTYLPGNMSGWALFSYAHSVSVYKIRS